MSSTLFNLALDWLFEIEEGYVNNPHDPGGRTKWGISQAAYPNLEIATLSKEQAADLYARDYWRACKCDDLPPGLAIAVFDGAVNHGTGAAITLLQQLLGVDDDGVVGPVTLGAAAQSPPKVLLFGYLLRRAMRYHETLMLAPSLTRFARGWFVRLFRLQDFLITHTSTLAQGGKTSG